MKQPPRDFSADALTDALAAHWGIRVRELDYLPLGFGGHHWRAEADGGSAYFLALHDLQPDADAGFERLSHALQTAYWLSYERGLEFVLAPLRNASADVVLRYGHSDGLAVYPWVNCRPCNNLDASSIGALLARLHASSHDLPPGLVRTEDFAIPWRANLQRALLELDRPWDMGPYGERARERLHQAARPTRELLVLYDRLAAMTRSSRQHWVVTHGEPYGPNLVETDAGRMLLVDWDSALIAARERDLWEMPPSGAAMRSYEQLSGVPPDPARLRLYRAWYHLAETGVYVHQFRQPHAGDSNDSEAWANFLFHLPSYANWPELKESPLPGHGGEPPHL